MKRINYLVVVLSICFIALSIDAKHHKFNEHKGALDRDGNGVLSFVEFSAKNKEMFSRLDQNGNGLITREELDLEKALKGKEMLSKWADRLDRNNDGKIDKKEFVAKSKRQSFPRNRLKRKGPPGGISEERMEVSRIIFKAADTDEDNFLSKEELTEIHRLGPKVEKDYRFKKLDSNGNNKLTREEFMFPIKKKFLELDKNSDQLLDRRELMFSFKSKKKKKKETRHENNMWKGKPPIKHKEKARP